jgi:hypothetical protein
MYSIHGILVYREKQVNNLIDIDISSLNSGIYIIMLTGIQQIIAFKVAIP